MHGSKRLKKGIKDRQHVYSGERL